MCLLLTHRSETSLEPERCKRVELRQNKTQAKVVHKANACVLKGVLDQIGKLVHSSSSDDDQSDSSSTSPLMVTAADDENAECEPMLSLRGEGVISLC